MSRVHTDLAIIRRALDVVDSDSAYRAGQDDGRHDAAYIATMHPGVGLALADWLLIEAHHVASHDCDAHCPPDGCDEVHAALGVARLINGGAS